MKFKLDVDLTQADIEAAKANGTFGNGRGCPISLSGTRALDAAGVKHDSVLAVGCAGDYYFRQGDALFEGVLPPEVADFNAASCRNLDDDPAVVPMQFVLEFDDGAAA